MAEKKTYEPLDELLESTGMKYSAIAEKSNIDKSYLYRLRKKPSKLDGELILRQLVLIKISFLIFHIFLQRKLTNCNKKLARKEFINERIN